MTEETQEAAENGYAEAWRPTPGDVLTGTLAGVEMIDPGGNGPYPVVTLQTPAGERNVHAFHSVLRRSLARRAPKIGDEVTITYLGERPGGKNGTYHDYKVRGGQGQEFDWATQLPAEERQEIAALSAEPPIPSSPTPSQSTQEKAADNFGDKPPF